MPVVALVDLATSSLQMSMTFLGLFDDFEAVEGALRFRSLPGD